MLQLGKILECSTYDLGDATSRQQAGEKQKMGGKHTCVGVCKLLKRHLFGTKLDPKILNRTECLWLNLTPNIIILRSLPVGIKVFASKVARKSLNVARVQRYSGYCDQKNKRVEVTTCMPNVIRGAQGETNRRRREPGTQPHREPQDHDSARQDEREEEDTRQTDGQTGRHRDTHANVPFSLLHTNYLSTTKIQKHICVWASNTKREKTMAKNDNEDIWGCTLQHLPTLTESYMELEWTVKGIALIESARNIPISPAMRRAPVVYCKCAPRLRVAASPRTPTKTKPKNTEVNPSLNSFRSGHLLLMYMQIICTHAHRHRCVAPACTYRSVCAHVHAPAHTHACIHTHIREREREKNNTWAHTHPRPFFMHVYFTVVMYFHMALKLPRPRYVERYDELTTNTTTNSMPLKRTAN